MIIKKALSVKEISDLLVKISPKQPAMYFSDKVWPYPLDLPSPLRNQRDSVMLDVMINIEQKPGIVIYIPNLTDEDINKAIDPVDDIEEVKDVEELIEPPKKEKKSKKKKGE